jgi:hypothetical protein
MVGLRVIILEGGLWRVACTPMPPRTMTRNVVVSSAFLLVLAFRFHELCRVGGRLVDG